MAVTASLRSSKKSDSSVMDVTTENVGALTQAPDFDGQLGLAPAPAPHTPSGVEHYAPNRYAAVSGGGLIGDFDESDVRHPTLRIVNGSGELSKTYHQGTLILGEEE